MKNLYREILGTSKPWNWCQLRPAFAALLTIRLATKVCRLYGHIYYKDHIDADWFGVVDRMQNPNFRTTFYQCFFSPSKTERIMRRLKLR